MSPADQDVVRRKLARIVTCLARIRAIRGRSLADYAADEFFQAVMERNFELMVGAAVDCNAHLLVRSGHPAPADAHTSFLDVSRELGALPHDLARRLAPAAGLRNRLVHLYEDIDQAKVYAALNEALEAFPTYVEAVEAFLQRN